MLRCCKLGQALNVLTGTIGVKCLVPTDTSIYPVLIRQGQYECSVV